MTMTDYVVNGRALNRDMPITLPIELFEVEWSMRDKMLCIVLLGMARGKRSYHASRSNLAEVMRVPVLQVSRAMNALTYRGAIDEQPLRIDDQSDDAVNIFTFY